MADLIPFPRRAQIKLVTSIVNELQAIHGDGANEFWRLRIRSIVAEMREYGMSDAAIRAEILDLHDAVQTELRSLLRQPAWDRA